MPPGGTEIRGEQQATMAGLIHQERVGKPFVKALSQLIDLKSGKITAAGLSPQQEAAVKEWRRDYLKDSALPLNLLKNGQN